MLCKMDQSVLIVRKDGCRAVLGRYNLWRQACYIVVGALITVERIVGGEMPKGDGACSKMQSIPRTSLLSLFELLAATGGIPVLGCSEQDFFFDSVATDSRNVMAGGMFIPLVGEFQDGHKYIPAALEKGATVVLVNKDFAGSSLEHIKEWHLDFPAATFVAVEHTMYGLQAAATAYVKKFPRLIRIGITGSSGKTTTKEILASLLSTRYEVVMNKGNLNSETGLPLSCFEIRPHHQVGVFELGMNRQGEMAEIAGVLSPKLGVITNIGTAHIGILGSKDGIAQEKKQIFSNYSEDSLAFIPAMDSYKDFLKEGLVGKVVEYGPAMVSSVRSQGLEGTFFDYRGVAMNLPLLGKANFYDALAALAVSQELGLTPEEIKKGFARVQPLFGRSEVLRGEVTFIQDCYNANPDSMEAALDFFCDLELDCGRKILVIADMLELGAATEEAHQKAVAQAQRTGSSLMLFLGDAMSAAANQAAGLDATTVVALAGKGEETIQRAVAKLSSFLQKGDVVLLKGSRGMGLERITAALQPAFQSVVSGGGA